MLLLSDLPPELILCVATFLTSDRDVSAFARAGRPLYDLLKPYLYRRNASHGCSSALWWAVPRARVDTVRRALAYGADWNSQCDEDGNPRLPVFIHAVSNPPNDEPHEPSQSYRSATFRLLVESGAKIDASHIAKNSPVKSSPPAVAQAASVLHGESAFLALVENGADIHHINGPGDTLLHQAAAGSGPDSILEFLIRAGLNVDARNCSGRTPLHTASWNLKTNAVHVLLQSGADPNAADNYNCAPLDGVMGQMEELNNSGNPALIPTIRTLLDYGANVHSSGDDGFTPLHHALPESWEESIVELFLEYGADINARNISGETPLHMIGLYGLGFPPLFLKNGADVHARDNNGDTPLHRLLGMPVRPVPMLIQIFLDAGADLHAVGHAGKSTYQLLEERGLIKEVSLPGK